MMGMPLVRSRVQRLAAPLLYPTTAALRGLALASVIANAVLICTGEAVRLSSSGLGCPDWPTCTKASLIAARSPGQTALNTAIEFGNRTLTVPLVIIAGLAFIAACRYRDGGRIRRDLIWLAAVLPAGAIAQAIVGGILVLTHLNPLLVSLHFLLSAGILAGAVLLHVRCGEGDGPARPVVRADVRVLAALLTAVTAVMLAAGTVSAGSGPLAGNAIAARYHLSFESATQLHADIGWFLGAIAVALVVGLRYSSAPRRVVRLGVSVLAGFGIQGVIGYVQYFTHLPAGLVWVHVACSVVLWILVVRFYLSTRVREPVPGVSPAAPAPVAQGAAT